MLKNCEADFEECRVHNNRRGNGAASWQINLGSFQYEARPFLRVRFE